MVLGIEVDARDLWLAFDLIGEGRSLGTGTVARIPGGATLRLTGIREPGRQGLAVLEFVLMCQLNVMSRVLANWLSASLEHRAVGLQIDQTDVAIDSTAIERLLTEKIDERQLSGLLMAAPPSVPT